MATLPSPESPLTGPSSERTVAASSSTIQLKAQGASYSNNPAYLRYLIIAEVVEIFMMAQGIGWFQGSNEGSKGEGSHAS